MKRLTLFLLMLITGLSAMAQQQPVANLARTTQAVSYPSFRAAKYFGVPTGATPSFPAAIPDSVKCGALFFKTAPGDSSLYYYDCSKAAWQKVGGSYLFTHDFTLNIAAGKTLGPYINGQTIPATGKTLDQLMQLLTTEAVHPTYTGPAAGISASPGAGAYEYGSNLGTVTLASTFTQNNAGAATGTTYYKNGTALSGNTDVISSLTGTVSYYVQKAYGAGACLNNNLGQQDCTGQIQAGTVNSGTISFTSYHKRYLGFASAALNGDGTPADADVRAAVYQDNNGGTIALTNTLAQQGSDKYLFFATTAPVNSITINGFNSTASFNMNIQRTFVNAAGGSFTYYFCVGKNTIGSVSSIAFTSN